ncbi:Rad4-domain-containing protein [Obba rivulosa]|uniref:Rad4-domain-containing protein n=1 Tax=Obba rivulosa TaxID=1052685 RepID=A0A8E2ASV1_9APHY|nr:Rad4-domain-containing protein [Obba rivulosa]
MSEKELVAEDESEDDFDWEEVEVPQASVTLDVLENSQAAGPSQKPNIEITIQTQKKGTLKKSSKGEQLYAERLTRLTSHKIHTVALLGNAAVRNKWINDALLHARLMSLTPLSLQNAFAAIHKSRVPEAAMRGRLFESAITRLVEWWIDYFEVEPTGHIRSRTFEEVQKSLTTDGKGKGKSRVRSDESDDEGEGELIRSEKSLMKHVLMRRGSRDTSAQLFTALCRALRIPTRLVVSLQSVPWQANAGKPKAPAKKPPVKSRGKGKEKAVDVDAEDEDEDMDMEEVNIPGSTSGVSTPSGRGVFPGGGRSLDGGSSPASGGVKPKAPPVINLRKSRGRKLGSTSEQLPRRERTPDPTTTAPVFWTEVFSRADARWIPVDPIRGIVNKRKAFDPTPNPNAAVKPDRHRRFKTENRMVYVLAFEEDGFARDVTPRYAREYGAKVAKIQQGGKGRKEWWEHIASLVRRPYRLHRDDLEDEELQSYQLTEAMPSSMAGFKDHPLYVLSRHLKRDEVVHPLVELGKFRGEPVYPRSNVLSLKTAENWMRQGRKVREGAQPMKWVKQRAMTVNKQRAIEMALANRRDQLPNAGEDEGEGFAKEDGVMQGLYAEHQTEIYKPDPVVDGKVPKNDFGNIDLYVPSMLPEGAAYVPYKGAAKIARQLGFDFAEAVTGFEFKKRRAFPLVTGVVVAAENEQALLEAYWEFEHDAEEKRRAKRHEQAIKRWIKLVQGLRIRQRLQEQYADGAGHTPRESSPAEGAEEPQLQGGFLTSAVDVVQPYSLPKNFHPVLQSSTTLSMTPGSSRRQSSPKEDKAEEVILTNPSAPGATAPSEDEDDMEEVQVLQKPANQSSWVPKTMRELAETAAQDPGEGAERRASEIEAQSAIQGSRSKTPLTPSTVAQDVQGNGRTRNTRASVPSTQTSTPSRPAKTSAKAGARRGRKRTRNESGSDVSKDDSPAAPSQSSPAKRARRPAAPVPAPTRVLRTRAAKSAFQQEREMEEAIERAIAD